MDEVGIGLEGAENMGQDGERGDVGLGFGGLQDITTRKLVSTQGIHSGSTGRPDDRELEQPGAAMKPGDELPASALVPFSRMDCIICLGMPGLLWNIAVSLHPP